jgi:hypothetical protein
MWKRRVREVYIRKEKNMLKLLLTDKDPEANSTGISIGRRLPVYNENIRPRITHFSYRRGAIPCYTASNKLDYFLSCNDNINKKNLQNFSHSRSFVSTGK